MSSQPVFKILFFFDVKIRRTHEQRRPREWARKPQAIISTAASPRLLSFHTTALENPDGALDSATPPKVAMPPLSSGYLEV